MPDITMCMGHECPIKETCYRYTAIPSKYWQSYFTETPYDHLTEDCDYFWEDELTRGQGSLENCTDVRVLGLGPTSSAQGV